MRKILDKMFASKKIISSYSNGVCFTYVSAIYRIWNIAR